MTQTMMADFGRTIFRASLQLDEPNGIGNGTLKSGPLITSPQKTPALRHVPLVTMPISIGPRLSQTMGRVQPIVKSLQPVYQKLSPDIHSARAKPEPQAPLQVTSPLSVPAACKDQISSCIQQTPVAACQPQTPAASCQQQTPPNRAADLTSSPVASPKSSVSAPKNEAPAKKRRSGRRSKKQRQENASTEETTTEPLPTQPSEPIHSLPSQRPGKGKKKDRNSKEQEGTKRQSVEKQGRTTLNAAAPEFIFMPNNQASGPDSAGKTPSPSRTSEMRADAPEFLSMYGRASTAKRTSRMPDPMDYLTPHKLTKTDELEIEKRALVWRVNDVGEEELVSPPFWVAGVNAQLRISYEQNSLCQLTLQCESKTKMKFELAVNGIRSGAKVCLGTKFSTTIKVAEGPQRVVFQALLMMP